MSVDRKFILGKFPIGIEVGRKRNPRPSSRLARQVEFVAALLGPMVTAGQAFTEHGTGPLLEEYLTAKANFEKQQEGLGREERAVLAPHIHRARNLYMN